MGLDDVVGTAIRKRGQSSFVIPKYAEEAVSGSFCIRISLNVNHFFHGIYLSVTPVYDIVNREYTKKADGIPFSDLHVIPIQR